MNKRIQQLAEQANLKLDELPDDTFIPLEKFAELIVRECADLVADDDNAFDVLKHFGVEE